jgi:hypothetical protein
MFLFDSNRFKMEVSTKSNNLQMTFAGYKKIQSNILYFTIKFKMLNKNNLIEGKIRFCFEFFFLFST